MRPLPEIFRTLFVSILLLTFLLALSPVAQAQAAATDAAIMRSLRDDYGFGAAFGWNAGDPCPVNFSGVTCTRQGRVAIINLMCTTTRLNEPIPPILANL